jgi:hypothetical protein
MPHLPTAVLLPGRRLPPRNQTRGPALRAVEGPPKSSTRAARNVPAAGKEARQPLPLDSRAEFLMTGRGDPITLLERQATTRVSRMIAGIPAP